jgi:signal transduction histidine kinase
MPDSHRPHILIVDDEAANMNALCDTLRGQGYETTGFTDAGAALNALRKGEFELVLADLVMPEMGGVDLLREAQQRDPDLVGVIMTGDGTIATAVEAMQTGALDYILKPLKLSGVLPVLSRALTIRRLRLENAALERSVRERTAALEIALRELEEQTSERLKAEEALRQGQKLEALGKLAGGIAHEFNNLLTVVVGGLDMIRIKRGDAERAVNLVDRAMMAVTRCAELTKQMLIFARRQVMHPRTLDLNRLISDFEPLLRHTIGANITLRIEPDPDHYLVKIDPHQFEAALLNLVMNARDAISGEGGIVIETRPAAQGPSGNKERPDTAPGGYVLVAVSDNGSGIAPDIVSHVFDPFFTTKAPGSGTGLGLSQVYGFIQESGGHVDIRSALGDGTTVELYLPCSMETQIAPTQEEGVMPPEPTRQKATVLVVEDEVLVLVMVMEYLDDLGYRVLTAQNAAEALLLIEGNDSIDILFSDVVMPGAMNGVQLASEARRLQPNIKVLLTSGYTADALSSQHGLGEDVPLLAKPYLRGELAKRLDVLARGSAD